jgi:hypothetical protein
VKGVLDYGYVFETSPPENAEVLNSWCTHLDIFIRHISDKQDKKLAHGLARMNTDFFKCSSYPCKSVFIRLRLRRRCRRVPLTRRFEAKLRYYTRA